MRFNRSRLPKGAGVLRSWTDAGDEQWFDRLPDHVKYSLDRSREDAGAFGRRGSGLGWEEVIYAPPADGTAHAAASNAIIVPDFSIPASYMTVGKILKYTIMGRYSSAITTPGTLIHILKWGGAGGVALVTSGTLAPDPTAASTNITWMVEYWVQCRSVGATGTFMSFGRVEWPDIDDATVATLKASYDMRMAPTATPAVVTVDTTIDKLLSVTATNSLNTMTIQTHMAMLEACN